MVTRKEKSTRKRWPIAALGVALGAVIGGVAVLSNALAVHQASAPFELDGNPTRDGAMDDWNNVFNLPLPYPTPRGVPTAGDGESFVVDNATLPGGKELSAWSGSNKDIDLIGTWEYKAAKVVPDKDNITNAYAKAYKVGGFAGGDFPGHPAGVHEHLIIYFGADRFANNGDAALGFWFFQDDVGLGPNGSFIGEHEIGDVLVQVDFVQGGSSSEVQIFKWVGSGGNFGALQEIKFGASNGAEVCTTDDTACAITNESPTASPWAFTPKFGVDNIFPNESFFEAGIDITALVGEVCFSSFMAETRSSHSETAELKDFALGDFDLCSVDVEKTCLADAQSPVVDPVNETFQTKHQVTINNDGFGAIYDIELRDNAVAAASGNTKAKVCAIASITGDGVGMETVPTGGTVFPNNTTFLPIADALPAGGTVTVTMMCITGENPFTNGVSVRAAATTGGAQTVTDSDTESDQVPGDGLAQCTKTLDTGLKLLKFCQGDPGESPDVNPLYQAGDLSVFLNPATGYKPEVCVDIVLSSTTSNQRMVLDPNNGGVFTDSDLGNLLQDASGQPIVITLEPMGSTGDTYTVSRCYTPTAPDGNQTDPGLATYSDTVNATGRGKINNATAVATPKTATCKLCPTCPDCPSD